MEARVEELAKTLEKLETSNGSPFGGALQAYQGEVLARLQELRGKMGEDSSGGGDLKKKCDQLKGENAELRKQVEKQNYRIAHLIRMLEDEESKR
mmetsp:Transcript_29073/g.65050  ORF Transcript_29073/g.65050 Transcript_29073/m.65050 type:complete len:95 (+) Transcript_29073:154-438(+)